MNEENRQPAQRYEMKGNRRMRNLKSTRLAAVTLLGLLWCGSWFGTTATATATGQTNSPVVRSSSDHSVPVSASKWAESIWLNAMAERPGAVLDRLHQLPTEHVDPDVRRLSEQAGEYFTHLDVQLDDRLKSYNEAIKKLEEHAEEENYREALADALAAHEMSLSPTELLASNVRAGELPSRNAVLSDRRIVNVIQRSEQAARSAERSGDWLLAQDYYYRLNALVNMDQRYEDDLVRSSQRIKLLSVYAPTRLRELTNAYLVKIGEKPRPGGKLENVTPWEKKVAGIDRQMAIEALSIGAADHLWAKGWDPLINGGLDAINTFLTTSDLQAVFPELKDDAARKRLVQWVGTEKAEWRNVARRDRFTAYTVLRHLQEENDQTVRLPEEVVYREFVEGAVSNLDKFSSMIWPDEMAMFNRQLNGSYIGVGIQISLDDAYRIKVVTPLENSPAMQAGVRAGDIITAIEGKSTLGITLTRAVDTITGRPGTEVTLTIQRPGVKEPFDVVVRRRPIKIETIKGWRRVKGIQNWDYMIDHENAIGYIRLVQQFGPSTASDFDRAIRDLQRQGVRSLILDLRFNPGGLLTQAVELCNRFVDNGLIVETVDPNGKSDRFNAMPHRASTMKDLPLVVLINEGSASASEIVAGCLKDHHRALLVGTRSYGKGSVQKVRRVAGDRARLRLTSEHYLLPSGKSIHRKPGSSQWGVDPNLLVRMTPKEIADTILLRQECDVLFDPTEGLPQKPIVANPRKDDGTENNDKPIDRNPDRLIHEPGYDLQLQTALLILQAGELPTKARHAVLNDS